MLSVRFKSATLGLIFAAAFAVSATADEYVSFGGYAPGNVPLCYNSVGLAVPCALSDVGPWAVTVTKPGAPAAQQDRAQVVTISPNSGGFNGFPSNSIPITGVGTGTTGAVTASLPATAGRTNYICQAQISALGGTATIGPITITGLKGGNTMTYQLASTAAGNLLPLQFTPCFPASAVNTAITATTTADGTASGVDVNLLGYAQ